MRARSMDETEEEVSGRGVTVSGLGVTLAWPRPWAQVAGRGYAPSVSAAAAHGRATPPDQVPCIFFPLPTSSKCQEQASLLCRQALQIHEGKKTYSCVPFPLSTSTPISTGGHHLPGQELGWLLPDLCFSASYPGLVPGEQFSTRGHVAAWGTPGQCSDASGCHSWGSVAFCVW